MPDLVTHTALGFLIVRQWRHAALGFLFLIGNMLPDLLTRPFYILFPPLYWWVYPFHTPLGIAVLYWGVAGLFRRSDRRPVFWSLTAGSMTHFALDAFQKHAAFGYLWLSPFSWTHTDWGLFWPGDSLRWLPAPLALVILMEIWLRMRRHRRLPSQARDTAPESHL